MMFAGGGGVINRNQSQLKQRTTVASSGKYAFSGSITGESVVIVELLLLCSSTVVVFVVIVADEIIHRRCSRGGGNAKKDGARESTALKDVSKGKDFRSSKNPPEDLGSFLSKDPKILFCVLYLDRI